MRLLAGRTRRVVAALFAAIALADVAVAAEPDRDKGRSSRKKEAESNFRGTVSVEEGWIDNVRAAATNIEGAWYTGFDGEASWDRGGRRGWLPHWYGGLVRGRVYSEFSERDFAQFGPSMGWDWKRVALGLEYRYSPETLRVDPEADANAFAETHNLYAELRSRFGHNKRWTVLLASQSDWEYYDPAYWERTHFEETIEGSVRCRATEMVQVRTGVAYAIRESRSENFDRDQATALFGFDLFLPWDMRALMRYEKTWRNFLVGYPTDSAGDRNSNYGREDDVNAFEAGLDLPAPWLKGATFHLRYRYRHNGSTRQDRDYTTNEGALRMTYAFD